MTTETVIEFVATDGRRFRNADACVTHEREVMAVAPIMAKLPKPRPRHGEYIQRVVRVLRRVKRDLFGLMLEKYKERFPEWSGLDPDAVHPRSFVGRVAEDNGGAIDRAWSELARYDFDSGREYDQLYFVSHPDEAVEAKP